MKKIRVAINGFGRIGRQILRLGYNDPSIQFVAINDFSKPEVLSHLLKYDSVHRKFQGEVSLGDSTLTVGQQRIVLTAHKDISKISWKDHNVDLVLECSGKYAKNDKAVIHIKNGAKKVLISAPSDAADVVIVMGVNHKDYDALSHHVVSSASCTTGCLAPVTKVMRDALGIEKAFMTTVHSYTNDQRVLDGSHRDLRRARAAGVSMIPTTSGATKSLVKIFPDLKGVFEGLSIRVPTPNVSLVDVVFHVKKSATADQVNRLFEKASKGPMKGVLGVSHEQLVSSDYIGCKHSATVDASLTQVVGKNLVKVIAWYDNEVGFSQRMLDLVKVICP